MPTLAEIAQAASALRTAVAEERRREQIAEVVRLALHNLDTLDTANHFLDRSQSAVRYWTATRDRLNRVREDLHQQLKELGFHDIGHARDWLTVPKESKVD
jgi:hypothetical protein